MHYFSSSLVLTAVQQERQIQKWSNELAVYCLGLNQGVNKKQVSGREGRDASYMHFKHVRHKAYHTVNCVLLLNKENQNRLTQF